MNFPRIIRNYYVNKLMSNSCVPTVASVSLRRRARGQLYDNYMFKTYHKFLYSIFLALKSLRFFNRFSLISAPQEQKPKSLSLFSLRIFGF